jgi:altronate hydrolase
MAHHMENNRMPTQDITVLFLNSDDNVAVTLKALPPDTPVGVGEVRTLEAIPAGHKVAVRPIAAGEPIRKYGHIIGFAAKTLRPGQHVHVHNVALKDFVRDYAMCADVRPSNILPPKDRATFNGFLRQDGRAATRNFIGVLATVSCSVTVARFIAAAFTEPVLSDYPNIDGIVALGHLSGCSMDPDGYGMQILQRTIAGYARHPNFGGILIVGLGCEVNHIDCLMQNMQLPESSLIRYLNIQAEGGTRETVRRGREITSGMLPEVDAVKRQPISADQLVVGLECGGSDAYSGISANPALGAAVDLLVRHGGTAILSETPEIYGSEHLLTRRAADRSVAESLLERIRWWEQYTSTLGSRLNNNPTPGNIAGGLTNIVEKSLGAVAKGGTTNLMRVYEYAEPVTEKGLVFMDTPGNDVVSITGMVAGGATLTCFTTGRGSVCGFKPVPTIKLASNSAMYRHMPDDMDVNCGAILDGEGSIPEMGETIFRLMLSCASGRKSKSEALGFGESEFAPWPMGAVL